jgi:hypothetical protein
MFSTTRIAPVFAALDAEPAAAAERAVLSDIAA